MLCQNLREKNGGALWFGKRWTRLRRGNSERHEGEKVKYCLSDKKTLLILRMNLKQLEMNLSLDKKICTYPSSNLSFCCKRIVHHNKN
jgi:hypothetical protein